MPQMAPYNWLILFFLFTIILIFINSYNYYMFFKKKKNTLSIMNLFNYKWIW